MYDRTAQNGGINGDTTWKGWAYYFNQTLRVASGMDRYGITAPQSTSNILKQAKELDAHEQSTDWNTVFKNSSDMAYFLNENKEKIIFRNARIHKWKIKSCKHNARNPKYRSYN